MYLKGTMIVQDAFCTKLTTNYFFKKIKYKKNKLNYTLTGLIPIWTSLSNIDLLKPALAVSLHVITGPNYLWSPTKITCLAPFNMGNKHSIINNLRNYFFFIIKKVCLFL